MGRQLILYMTDDDEQQFLRFVKSAGEVEILPERMSSPSIRLETLPRPRASRFWSVVYFYNRAIPGELTIRKIEGQRDYAVNFLSSPVIQFRRSFLADKKLKPGRIWAEFTWLDRERPVHVPKSPDFERWYKTNANWIRKNYKAVRPMTYAGPGALRFQDEGGELA